MHKKAFGAYEIARRCQVTPGTVNNWIKNGKIPAFKTAGGHFRVWESDLNEFLKSLNISPTEQSPMEPLRVLIVDDELPIRRLIRRLVEKTFPKAKIEEASDGYEAGYKTRAFNPFLITLDLHLPGIDGIKVCRMVKKDKDLKTIKIIAITGHQIEKTKRIFLRAGADAFLAKPFDNDEFIHQVRELVGIKTP